MTRALARVGRIILAAGAIMTAVFLGFVGDPDVVVKTIGLGLASAILIDVLIVRMIVAPAVMTLLGDRAWALPGLARPCAAQDLPRRRAGTGLGGTGAAPAGAAPGQPAASARRSPGTPQTVKSEQQHERDAVHQHGVERLARDQVAPALDQRRERVDRRDRVDPAAEQA